MNFVVFIAFSLPFSFIATTVLSGIERGNVHRS
jgi:hypothetical protein